MSTFWKRLLGRRDEAAEGRAEIRQVETPAERKLSHEGPEGIAADAVVEERLGGVDLKPLVDDEFKP
jgi:hypothetical protein